MRIKKTGLLIALITTLFFQCSLLGQSSSDIQIPPFREAPVRDIKYPLKDKRTIYGDSLIDIARKNVAAYSSALTIQTNILKRADYWLQFNDEELSNLITSAAVPRAFDLCIHGCPVHGDSIFKVAGAYPWIVDPEHPFQVKCPIGGEIFPSNDYAAYYSSGFMEKKDWDTRHVDDGWGWVSPNGDRYWFVAYANHWTWNRHVLPGLLNLAEAYLLTGDNRYAFQAIDMLYRVAQVYPSMDYENQSRYGLMMKQRNVRYPGKILNRIWETVVIRDLANSYDMVWDQIDNNTSLQERVGKTGKEVRAFIEANLLEEGLDAIKEEKIVGNFGMHQHSLVSLHLSRQHAQPDQAMDRMLNNASSRLATTGLRYALYNQIGRDGIPFESPGYNNIWVNNFTGIAESLHRGGVDLFTEYRLKKMLDAPLDMVAIGLYTPDIGDGGSVMGGLIGKNSNTYHIAYNYYKDNRYLNWINASGADSFTSFGSLFREPLPSFKKLAGRRAVSPRPSRLFAGYGVGILNNKPDKTAISFTYGMHYSHYHWDFLNIEIFANGQKMMPDLGYPDAMNDYVPGIYTWSTNTISHNTVVVDQQRQQRNLPGTLHDFTAGTFARVMDASSPAYSNTKTYRRNIVMVDTDDNHSYFIDFFHVEGGTRHDYSLHGPPGSVKTLQGTWSDTIAGTFAGPEVSIGYIYDNAKLQAEGHQTGYSSYGGSGFQHLFNVQHLQDGDALLEYRHACDTNARLRVMLLPDGAQEVHMADAFDKPRAREHILKYIIATRESKDGAPLKSRFVSILEPYKKDNARVSRARLVKLDQGNGQVVIVQRDSIEEIIMYDPSRSRKVLHAFDIETDAASVVATFKGDSLTRLFCSQGTYFYSSGRKFVSGETRGTVRSINPITRSLQVQLESLEPGTTESLQPGVAFFSNPYRTTAHPLQSIAREGGNLEVVTEDDLLIGRLHVNKAEDNRLETGSVLTFAASYTGATLLDKSFKRTGLISTLKKQIIELDKETLSSLPRAGEEAWISNVGVRDTFIIHPVISWENIE